MEIVGAMISASDDVVARNMPRYLVQYIQP